MLIRCCGTADSVLISVPEWHKVLWYICTRIRCCGTGAVVHVVRCPDYKLGCPEFKLGCPK